MSDWHKKTLRELSVSLSEEETTSVKLTQYFLDRIAAQADLNAFISVDADVSLAQAKAADVRIASGKATELTGIPIAHKDIFVTRDFRTTAASKMLANYVSPFDATVVQKLACAGMVTIGKTNCDEFAMGSSNENSYFGAVKNPWDKNAIPGGSSGGSAAAVAAGLAPAATGTDTGGSIRQPAAMCGLTGIKPTYGRVSRWGMIAYASSLDQGGPMAKSAEDCALLLNHMTGFDPRDSTSVDRANEDYTRKLSMPLNGLKIGVPIEWMNPNTNVDPSKDEMTGIDLEIRIAVGNALSELEKLGAERVSISLPHTESSVPAYYVIAPAEASSNLSRFDGVRYGHRAAEYRDLQDMYQKTRAEGFGSEVKRRILVGAYVLSHGYYDAYYIQAQKIRRLIANDFQAAFQQCDVIMGPVSPTVAWDLGAKVEDPIANYLADIFTLSTNLAGLPGMSIPCGFRDPVRRPIGLQIIGNYFDEAKMLGIAHQFQLKTGWHKSAPGEI